MSSNQRKRPADASWGDDTPSRISRLSNPGLQTPVPVNRRPGHGKAPRDISSASRNFWPSSSLKEYPENTAGPSVHVDHRSPHIGSSHKLRHEPNTPTSKFKERKVRRGDNPTILSPLGAVHKPQVLHRPHPKSKLCEDFHWVPYPLGLLPYDSWHMLHYPATVYPPLPFRCPVCTCEREPTPHIRKTFLVAERLAWDENLVPVPDQEQNQELNWQVNFELGILDPFMEDQEKVSGGKESQKNRFHPYLNEYEMKQALKLIFTSEDITETSWSLWIGMQMDLQNMLVTTKATSSNVLSENSDKINRKPLQYTANKSLKHGNLEFETIDLTTSPDYALNAQTAAITFDIPTPPSSVSELVKSRASSVIPRSGVFTLQPTASDTQGKAFANNATGPPHSSSKHKRIISYETLSGFYSLLDRIERTSFVGALFLEAYAERLRDDMCRNCWLKRYIDFNDVELE
jgi:hypothetical protein